MTDQAMDLDAPSTSAAAAVASPAVAEAPQASTSAAGEVATEGTAAVATTTRSSARGQSDSVRVVKQWNALDKAVQKFSEVLTPKRMQQAFPEQGADLNGELRTLCLDRFKALVSEAWTEILDANDFVARAEAFDRVLADAKSKKDAKKAPRNDWLKAGDPHITVPSKTIPILRDATASLRARREEEARQNAALFEAIKQRQAEADKIEKRSSESSKNFRQALETLSTIDMKELMELETRMVDELGDV